MSVNVKVDTVKMRDAGNDILKYVNELKDLYNSMFLRIENIPESTHEWEGRSCNLYVESVRKEKIKYLSYLINLYKYGKFLIDSAEEYEKLIREIKR